MRADISAVLYGTLVGVSWAGRLASKEIKLDLPYRRRGSFVWSLEHACKDGDFQTCKLDPDSVIEVKSVRVQGRSVFKVVKVFSIEEFPSAALFIYRGEKS